MPAANQPAPTRPCPGPHPHAMVQVKVAVFACREHWSMLPAELKRELGDAWQARCAGVPGATQRHIDAKNAATAWLQANG